MSWSESSPFTSIKRAAFGAFAVIVVAACGFTPIYGPNGSGTALINRVTVTHPSGSNAFTLAQELEERLGPPLNSRYELTFTLDTDSDPISITQTQETNRFNIIGSADYVLTEQASGAVAQSGSVDGFTSYSATGTTVATAAAEQNSYDRLMVILANKIIDELVTLPIQTANPTAER